MPASGFRVRLWRRLGRRGYGAARPPALFAWRDPLLALAFFLAAVQLRRPYKMLLPYAWDSLLFLRAVDHFNATIHQPQPPGYLFYVATARVIDLVLGDPHRALVWVSILASAVAVAVLYLLARLLFDWVTGVVAASLLLTSVTFWFYGEVAYPYTTLAAGSITLALLALALRRGLLPGARGVALAALAFGLVAGFRQDLLLFLAPLFAAALWGRPPRQWLLGLVAGALGVLCWLLPTAALSEGLARYLAATLHQGGAASGESSTFTVGLAGLRTNARELAIFLSRGLYFALVPLVYVLARGLVLGLAVGRRRLQAPAGARLLAVMAAPAGWDGRVGRGWSTAAYGWVLLWLAPPLLFYLLAHIGDYGYTFSVLPVLLVLAARGLVLGARDLLALGAASWRRLSRRAAPSAHLPRAGAVLALLFGLGVAVADARVFLAPQGQFSVGGIRCFNETMRERMEIVREDFPPRETLIVAAGYYQHVRYFLPEYRAWLHAPSDGRQVGRAIPTGARHLLVFDEVARPADRQAGFAHYALPCNGAPFYVARVRPGDVVRFDVRTATIVVERPAR